MSKEVEEDYQRVCRLLEYLESCEESDSGRCLMIVKPFIDRTISFLLFDFSFPSSWEEDLHQYVYVYFLESIFGKGRIDLKFEPAQVCQYIIRCVSGLFKNFRRSILEFPTRSIDSELFREWVDHKSWWPNVEFEIDCKEIEKQIDDKIEDYIRVRRKVDREVVKRMITIQRWRRYERAG